MPERILTIIKNCLLPILLGSGLFFINIRPYHDWGDDFAQYLQQAHNLAEGKSLEHSNYIHNSNFLRLGPLAYPPGFPALLVVSNTLYEDEIVGGQILISCLLLAMGLVLFSMLLKAGKPYLLSLIVVLTLWYHPWMLHYKSQVLSDIPFAFFMLLSVFYMETHKNQRAWLWAALSAGFAISIRSAGWVLPMAGVVSFIFLLWQNKKPEKKWLYFSVFSSLWALFILWLSGYTSGSGGYTKSLERGASQWLETPIANFQHYWQTLYDFVLVDSSFPQWLNWLLMLMLGLALIIASVKLVKRPFSLFLIAGYCAMLLYFPFTAGFRFLIPLVPLLVYVGMQAFHFRKKGFLIVSLLILIGLNWQYQGQRSYIVSQQDKMQEGPQTNEAEELFEFINTNVDSNSVVMFSKPRALAYYAHVRTASSLWQISQPDFESELQKFGVTHLLQYYDIPYAALHEFVEQNPKRLDELFSNEGFALYEIRQTVD